MEFAAPVWTPGLTQKQVHQIEMVQMNGIHIFLGEKYSSYKRALKQLKVEKTGRQKEGSVDKIFH